MSFGIAWLQVIGLGHNIFHRLREAVEDLCELQS